METKLGSIEELLKENFCRYRAKDLVLVRKLQRSSILAENEVVELLLYWHSRKVPKQTLVDFLIANEVLTPNVLRAIKGRASCKLRHVDGYINEQGLTSTKNRIARDKLESSSGEITTRTTADDDLVSTEPRPDARVNEIFSGTKSTVPRVGMRLGKCRLTKVIGRGTSGIVYQGVHETLQIPVAVKVFLPQNNSQAKVIRKQFGAEAKSLAKLNHRSIVRILDFEEGLHPYLILEYIDGKSLEELIRDRGRIDYQQAAYYIYCVAGGLASAHEKGIIHRDIKPANILVTRNDEAKLADLGIAQIRAASQRDTLDESAVSSDSLPGTPAYIAPELAFTTNPADTRSDIYSLGATFYHAVAGRYPFEGESAYMMIMKHVHEPLKPPHELVSEIPSELSALINKMMAKKPEDRFQSVEEMLPDLLTFFLGSGLYNVNKDLKPINSKSDTPMFGTRTRVLINTARRIIASSREHNEKGKKRSDNRS